MLDAPKPFWYLAGIALLAIAVPIGWRIANTNQPLTVDAGSSGVSVTLSSVQQSIADAQASVTQYQQQAMAQSIEISKLEEQLRADQSRINTLVDEIQHSSQVPASVKASARNLQEQQAQQVIPSVPTVDTKLLTNAQASLTNAHNLAEKLLRK